MAVEKSALVNSLTKEQRKQTDFFEKKIDSFLEVAYRGEPVEFHISNEPLDKGIKKELWRRYKKAGWSIRFFGKFGNGWSTFDDFRIELK